MGLFNDTLGKAAKWATEPLINVPDVGWIPGNVVERGVSELTSPIGLASAALFPVSGGTSLGLRGALGAGARLGTRAAGETAVNVGGNAAASFVNDRLPESTPGALRLAANLGAGAVGGGAVSSAVSGGTVGRGLQRLNSSADDLALEAADPTALTRAKSPDFEVVGRGVGKAAPDFKMLKPGPGKSPSDVLGRLPENAELVIEPRRLVELEDNLPAQKVWLEFAPEQRFNYTDDVFGTRRSMPAVDGVFEGATPAEINLGRWWEDSVVPREDLRFLDQTNRGGPLTDRPFGRVSAADPGDIELTWRTAYDAGEKMRKRLRQLSGSDEIELYRGQPLERGGFAPPQIAESYSPLPEKAASFSDPLLDNLGSPTGFLNRPVLARRVKIDDILGTLGRTPDGTSEFIVLNRNALHPMTYQQITGITTEIPRVAPLVDPSNFGRSKRTLAQRAGLEF